MGQSGDAVEEPSSIVDQKVTMVEEPEETTMWQLAEPMTRGVQIRSWVKRNGVPERTAYRWAADPKVRIEVQAARRRMFDRAAGPMTSRCQFAVSRISTVASDAESETVQLNALKTILTDAMGSAKYSDLEVRLAEFEEKIRRDPQSFSPLPR